MDWLESGAAALGVLVGMLCVTLICVRLTWENLRLQQRNRALGGLPGASLPSWPRFWFVVPCAGLGLTPAFLVVTHAEPPLPLERHPLAAFLPPPAPPVFKSGHRCEPIPPSLLRPHLEAVARRERVSVELLLAVIHQESRFSPCAVSASGALGMMQLKPETAAELGVRDPFDPRENISGGARLLRNLLVRYHGNIELALAAYNAGPGPVDSHRVVPPIPETRAYVADILDLIR